METTESVRSAFDLTGRVALVTGAAKGIGRTAAEVLAAAGASVVCADIDLIGSEETAKGILDAGGAARPARVDVTERDALSRLVGEVVGSQGALHIMCNIAGIIVQGSILDLEPDEFDRILSVNLKGVLYGCQAAGRVMVEQGGGSIINMASMAVLIAAAGAGAYSICKAGVAQLTKSMAVEVGPYGVRVNTIAPAYIPTPMTARYYTRPDGTIDAEAKAALIASMSESTPLRRVGDTSDIGYCVLYLASDASSFLTGQLLSPNGGLAMHY